VPKSFNSPHKHEFLEEENRGKHHKRQEKGETAQKSRLARRNDMAVPNEERRNRIEENIGDQ